jgi:ABC-2 type transport system ATP-binding protein
MREDNDAAIVVEGVHKRFAAVQALAGVELTVPRGSCFGLVGPNGAGKTTLFSIISGFLRPSAGRVRVLGEEHGAERLRGRLAVLPQDAAWRKGVPLGKQMALCARLQGLSAADAPREVVRVLTLTGMADCVERHPDKLSHGMAKRVAIAQALIGDPEVVLLDEPISGLDPAQARAIRLLIQGERGKRTFLVSSHDMSDIEALCSHVAIIKAGRIVEQRRMDELTRREAVVVFTLTEAPTEALAAPFRALPFVSAAEVRPVERKLQLTVRVDQKGIDEAAAEFIKILVEHQANFVGLQKGTSLEDAVLKAT